MNKKARVPVYTRKLAWLSGLLMGIVSLVNPVNSSEVVTYYYVDQQGTVLARADAAGDVLASNDYRPYGVRASGTADDGPGYAGHVGDGDSGLVYMQARYYDPQAGRFLSVDPVSPDAGVLNGFNRYSYVGNNPVTDIDADGRQCAQCLYYPGDTSKQAKITEESDKKALAIVSVALVRLAEIVAPQLSEEAAPIAEEIIEASQIESESLGGDESSATASSGDGNAFPDRPLPRNAAGRPVPEPDANGPHTQLGRQMGRHGGYNQAREFDKNGDPVRDIDFTDHNRPANHTSPHQHRYIPNPTGGTPRRGPAEPLPSTPQAPII